MSLTDRELVLETVRRLNHPILNWIFFERLRDYQLDWLLDFSTRKIAVKGRRLGFTEVDALDTVFTASGFWEALNAPVHPHNVNVISKRDKESKDYIRRCNRWIRLLTHDWTQHLIAVGHDPEGAEEMNQAFQQWFALERDNDTFLEFAKSGWRVQSDTQSEDAGRGQEGHLKKDEASRYKYAREIISGADKIPLSNPKLRLCEFSTPNGTEGRGEYFARKFNDTSRYPEYSRHRVDIYTAIEDGFPITVEEARAECVDEDDFLQEFCCEFIGSADSYIGRQRVQRAYSTPPNREPDKTIVGIDVASEVDLTAVVVLRQYGALWWIEDVYVVKGVGYRTDTEKHPLGHDKCELGQEHIIAGLLWDIRPDAAIMDASADGSVLYGQLLGKADMPPIVPHSFHRNGREWKATWVPEVRAALDAGSLCIENRPPQVYQKKVSRYVDRDTAGAFVEVAFREHHFDLLENDFAKIKRVQLESGVSYKSPRDESGHGDTFWAACMAFSITGATQREQVSRQKENEYSRVISEALDSVQTQRPKTTPHRPRASDNQNDPTFMEYL